MCQEDAARALEDVRARVSAVNIKLCASLPSQAAQSSQGPEKKKQQTTSSPAPGARTSLSEEALPCIWQTSTFSLTAANASQPRITSWNIRYAAVLNISSGNDSRKAMLSCSGCIASGGIKAFCAFESEKQIAFASLSCLYCKPRACHKNPKKIICRQSLPKLLEPTFTATNEVPAPFWFATTRVAGALLSAQLARLRCAS